MKYIANPVTVDAFEITWVGSPDRAGLTPLRIEDGRYRNASGPMCARYAPVVGDFWVIQEDGYCYLNPRDVFLRKYRPVDAAPDVDLSIASDGTVSGTPEAVALFREFCASRNALLNIRKPLQCQDCGHYVVGGGCTCSVETRENRRLAAMGK